VEEALAAERARQASDAPSDSAPSEAPSLAPDEADATRTGAPDAVVEEQRRASAMTTSMSDEGASAMSSMAADGAATMARTSAMSPEAATRVIHCGSRPQEVPIVRPGDTVRVTFRQTNNVVPMATFSAATASWTPRLTSCYVGHPFVGGMFTLELDASGRVTKLRRNPFCGAPAALERCLEQALEGTAIGNDTGAPAEMRFDVSHQGSG
ncbi:MAG: hypothetical protein KF901_32710, partial [Myxococcales bacterium]|nr:hypothetical protein [Myxococcales bacterium]